MEKDLIGKKVKGFKFETNDVIGYNTDMDNFIGKVGIIEAYQDSNDTIIVQFDDCLSSRWFYPASLIEHHLVEEENIDVVNNPSHYTKGGIECIDAIEASMTPESFKGFLKGNIQKYLYRYESKENPLQDVKKAQWYLNKLIEKLADNKS